MTIPSDPAEIENLKKIAALNVEAGDWQYSPIPDPISTNSKSATETVLKQIGDKHLPPKK